METATVERPAETAAPAAELKLKWYVMLGLVNRPVWPRPGASALVGVFGGTQDGGGWGSVKLVGPFNDEAQVKKYLDIHNNTGLAFQAVQL